MLIKYKKIAIIGGGPGGLTLARLLQGKGANVTVFERDISKEARVQGSPLDMHHDSGLAALQAANLLEEFKNTYRPGADKTLIVNEQAEVLFSDHHSKTSADFGHPDFRPEIDRGPLRNMLLQSLLRNTVRWNSHFISLEPQEDGYLMHFKNAELQYADLVIGADGSRSKIRPNLTTSKPFYTGVTMLEGTVPHAKQNAPRISQLVGEGKMMAFGREQNILLGQKGNGDLGFYASFLTDENWSEKSKLNFTDRSQIIHWFRTTYQEWSTIWYELFEQAETPFIPRPIYCAPLDQYWETLPNMTMIGDAAHVMPPFAGEGANMAMLDALELSNCLTNEKYLNLREAIAVYETNMRKRAAQAAGESLENGKRMHAKNALSDMVQFFDNHA